MALSRKDLVRMASVVSKLPVIESGTVSIGSSVSQERFVGTLCSLKSEIKRGVLCIEICAFNQENLRKTFVIQSPSIIVSLEDSTVVYVPSSRTLFVIEPNGESEECPG